jgi:hypothetical protein
MSVALDGAFAGPAEAVALGVVAALDVAAVLVVGAALVVAAGALALTTALAELDVDSDDEL